jgi:2-polyprenyl-6-methoxyphenol hydroxylase-like FAD-dependent oxidoreductase
MDTANSESNQALIVGGGIGGLAAAAALARVGIAADVYERASAIQEVGAGLSLWSNAVLALRRLGLDGRIIKLGSVVERIRTVTAAGRVLSESDIGALGCRAGAPSVCIHRADLQSVLAEAVGPGRLHTGRTCTGFREHDGGVMATFTETGGETGAFLIGADGIRSVVRDQLLGRCQPRRAGYLAWRGMATFDDPRLPAGLALFVSGAGTQLGLFHCGPGRVYWFATHNSAGATMPSGRHRAEVLRVLDGWPAVVRAVVEATHESAVLCNDVVDRPPVWPWGRGRVSLLGDAVHPTTPNLGQGACQALEDAVVLAHALRAGGDISSALRAYEQRRRSRTAWVTKQSWSLGKVLQWQKPLAVKLRDWVATTRFGQRQAERVFEEMLLQAPPELN